MPLMPWKQCPVAGCPELVRSGRCDKHKPPQRTNSAKYQNLYSYRWDRYSKGRLKKHPLCVLCLANDITRAATLTDHIVPHKGARHLFWDYKNHQSLCTECHNKKTYEEGAFGK